MPSLSSPLHGDNVASQFHLLYISLWIHFLEHKRGLVEVNNMRKSEFLAFRQRHTHSVYQIVFLLRPTVLEQVSSN